MNPDKRLKPQNPTGASSTCFKQPEAPMFLICYPVKNTKCTMTEHCVSDIGTLSGEPYNIYDRHTCRKINIFFLI